MPHAKSICENMEEFISLHRIQLEQSGIPEHFWNSLFIKLKLEKFDAGLDFIMQQVVEEPDSEDDDDETEYGSDQMMDDGDGQQLVSLDLSLVSWRIIACQPIKLKDQQSIYLIDHAWTYRLDQARNHLETTPGLLPRIAELTNVEMKDRQKFEVIEDVLKEMWKFNQTYNLASAELGTEAAVPLWYVMDEFGSRIQHSDDPNVRLVPFCYMPTKSAYTIMWPIVDLKPGDEVTKDYLNHRVYDGLTRKLLLLPWQPDDMRHLSYDQKEDDQLFESKFSVHESLPNLLMSFVGLQMDRNIRVYSDVDQVLHNLTDLRFEFVKSVEEADVVWTKHYLKDFKSFSEESSAKFINQFPFEMVLTVKNMLAVVCRRSVHGPGIDHATLESFPAWLPATFDLRTEIPHFVSYFQHREARGLDNHWICKPYNLARGLDTHITNDLNSILRLSESGPKIVSKYVEDPVLIERDDVGLVKFDLRFVVMLTSVCPLELLVHKKFVVRVSNKIYSLDNLDDYEKHFTVMNYRKDAVLKQISCETFVEMFNQQYQDMPWCSVMTKIQDVVREMFLAATQAPPPRGIGHSPQSRAIYGVDIMLKWTIRNGVKTIEPVLLECNFGPDNTRLLKSYPDFINDIFSCLFLYDIEGRDVTIL